MTVSRGLCGTSHFSCSFFMPFSLGFAYFTNFKYFKTLVKHRCFSIPNFGGAHSLCGESPTCARATISALGILRLSKIASLWRGGKISLTQPSRHFVRVRSLSF